MQITTFIVLAGAVIGFMFGRVVGAIFGAGLGWWIARGLVANTRAAAGENFQFTESTFAVMGCICKSDGRVDEREIAVAEAFMRRMKLTGERRDDAIVAFARGKKGGFKLDAEVAKVRETCGGNVQLMRIFLEVQLQAVLADGVVNDAERAMLVRVARGLGLSEFELRRLEAALRFASGQYGQHGRAGAGGSAQRGNAYADAYAVLGVDSNADDAEIKKAYRKLMSEHHPDKLAARGLPESMREVAEQKTREITRAYEMIKEARGL